MKWYYKGDCHMKCYYFLSPTLESTESISDDLRKSGVADWFIHIISKNEAGLNRKKLHSSNYIETMDFMRHGLIGASLGFAFGIIFSLIMIVTEPVGPGVPLIAYAALVFLFTCFGAWQGGLVGISKENRKLAPYHQEIHTGKYLILVYAPKKHEKSVTDTMRRLHPEAELVGIDTKFYNPFAQPATTS
jgi:hypothetical protein